MRLLNIQTLKLETCFDPIPEYAILSHTWGDSELTFDDVRHGYLGGSIKIDGCCCQAASDGLRYVWIDTICIDKTSSAELTEAINSMFAWYRGSKICYAYLADVSSGDEPVTPGSSFRSSRWFTRGWTLQELIAPAVVDFFSSAWIRLGTKTKGPAPSTAFLQTVQEITAIPEECLDATSETFRDASVAQKMSWAASRETTRKEDRAYSLLGLFGVYMPMLYGEGDNAFVRLQEEIMRLSDDKTILAWGYGFCGKVDRFTSKQRNEGTLFARSPDDFRYCGTLVQKRYKGSKSEHYFMTNRGLRIDLMITKLLQNFGTAIVNLECTTAQAADTETIALQLVRLGDDNDDTYGRIDHVSPTLVPSRLFSYNSSTAIYIRRTQDHQTRMLSYDPALVVTKGLPELGYVLTDVYPPCWKSTILAPRAPVFICPRPAYDPGEMIFMLYKSPGRPALVARMDYSFNIDDLVFSPGSLECSLSLIEIYEDSDQDITKLFGPYLGEAKLCVDWQRSFDRWTDLEWRDHATVDGHRLQVSWSSINEGGDAQGGWNVKVGICEPESTPETCVRELSEL